MRKLSRQRMIQCNIVNKIELLLPIAKYDKHNAWVTTFFQQWWRINKKNQSISTWVDIDLSKSNVSEVARGGPSVWPNAGLTLKTLVQR